MGKSAETQMSLYENELESMAKVGMVAERSAAGQIFLSTKGGILTYRDQPISGNAIDVVILASPVERLCYMERYDAANPAPPVCYAIGASMAGLKPNPLSPSIQSEFCSSCPKDQWGSALNGGKGKGCAEKRRLLIMTADSLSTASAVQTAEVAALRTPVTSVKGFATYLQTVSAATKRPLSAVITKISLVPDSKTQFKLKFDFVKAIEDLDLVKALISRGQHELEMAVIAEVADEAPEAPSAPSGKY